MATSYTGLRVQDTYNAIIKIGDNSNLTATPKLLSDGLGNDSPLYLSGTRLGIGISPAYQFHTSGNAKIGGDVIISGDLTVNGDLTYLNVEDLAVEDPLIKLAKDNTANTLDIGLFGKYVATGTKYKGFFNDASDDKFKLFIGTTVEPGTTVDTSASGYTKGNLVIGNLEATGGDFSDTVYIDDHLEIENSSGYGYIELGGSSGGYIDLKGPFSNDFDLRVFTDGTNSQINAIAGALDITSNSGIDLQYQGSNKLTVISTGIDVTGNLFVSGGIKDSDGDLGTSGQLLSSTGTGTNWIDFEADVAKRLEVTVKNVSGGSLAKGVVVHAAPTATPPSGNVIEVIAADANVAASMPAIGVLNETIADEAEGEAVMFGAVSGIDTSSFTAGDDLYVSETAGAFTATKPTAFSSQVQKIAVVIKSHASNGLIKVFGAGRSNDVPNRVDRDMNFTDGSKLEFGTDSDLEMYHDGTDGYIDNINGELIIQNNSNDKKIIFKSDNGIGDITEYFRIDGNINRNVITVTTQLNDNVPLIFGGGAGRPSIKYDSTATQLFISGESKFLNDLYCVGDVYLTDGTNSSTLQFENDAKTRKIVLYEGADNDYQFYGFGVENSTLVYSTYSSGDDHVFFVGVNSTNRSELMRIKSTGDVNVANSIFSEGLYVNSNSAVSGTQVAIVKDGDVNLQRWGTSSDGTSQDSYRFRIDQNMKFIANSGSGDTLTIFSDTGNIQTSGTVTTQGVDGGAVIRNWTGNTDYVMWGTSNMSGSEYSIITDGTHTFLSGGDGGSVHIRSGNNTSTHQLVVSDASARFYGDLYIDDDLGVGTTDPQNPVHVDVSAASGAFISDTNIYALEISNSDTTAGNAVGMTFGHGGFHYTNFIASVRTTTGDNPAGDLVFGGRSGDAAAFVERMRITKDGLIKIGSYGSGTHTGTVAKNLAVDSSGNIIETDGGVVDGSGTANYIPKWSDANTLTDSVMYESSGDLIASGNLYIGDDASNNQGLRIESGNGTSDYGVVRFLHGGTNRNTIHAFSQYWQSGTIYGHATDTLNLDGNAGVTIGPWNDIDVAFVQGSTNYFKNAIGIGQTTPTSSLHITQSTPSITLETSANANDPVITLKSDSAIGVEGAQMYYDNSVGTFHIQTTFADDAADIVFHTATGADQGTNNVRMRIGGNGNVGIGVDNADSKLHVQNGSAGSVTAYVNTTLTLESSATDNFLSFLSPAGENQGILFGDADANWRGQVRYDHATDVMFLYTAATERLTINTDGRVTLTNSEGIQLSAKTSTLYATNGALSYYSASNGVYLNGAGPSGWLRLQGAGTENDRNSINIYGSAGDYMNFRTGNITRLTINNNGTLLVGDTVGPSTVWDGAAVFGQSGQRKVIIGFLDTALAENIVGGHNSALTAWDALTIAGSTLRFRTGSGIGNVSMDIDSSGNIQASLNQDTTYEFGRVHLNYMGHADHAGFSHIDQNSTSSYALLQNASGQTYLNAPSGQDLRFRIQNNDVGCFNGSSFNFGVGTNDPDSQMSGTKGISIVNATNAALGLSNGTTHWLTYLTTSADRYRFWNSVSNEVMTILSGGNVGIANDGPNHLFELGNSNSLTTGSGYKMFSAGAFGVLFRNNYDCYIAGNTQYTSSGWVNKYGGRKSSIIGLPDGQIEFNIGTGTTQGGASNLTVKQNTTTYGTTFYVPATGTGSGDYTNVQYYPYKVDSDTQSSDYWRIPHLSGHSAVAGVYNYETGKNVYWGEPSDTGTYEFRGRYINATSSNTKLAEFTNNGTAATFTIGDASNTQYCDLIIKSNSGTGEIFKAGSAYTSYGGASSLNIYNSNGIIAFHPAGQANKVQFYGLGPGIFANATGYGDNGSGGNDEYAVVGYAESGNQATIGAEHAGDGYANLNLGSNVSGRKFWHISKRTSSDAHRLEYYYYDGSFTSYFKFEVGGTFTATADVIAYSDKRLKENIVTIDNALEKVTKLRGVSYNRTDATDKSKKIGVIAQEVNEVLPEVVSYDKNDDIYGVDYGKMAGVFIEAIKDLKTEINELKAEIKQLKK